MGKNDRKLPGGGSRPALYIIQGSKPCEPDEPIARSYGPLQETAEPGTIVAWEPCEACGEFWCNVHEMHAHDCDCPALDEWVEHGLVPYDFESESQVRVFCELHSYEESPW